MRLIATLVSLCLLPAAATPQSAPAPEARPALAAFERVLDRAVARVAPPSPMAMLAGPGGSHGYHLRGQGAFFVLPARRLPMRRSHVFLFHAPPGPVLAGPEGDDLAQRVTALHEEAERVNREAEQAYRRVRQEIYVRFRDGREASGDAETPGVETVSASGAHAAPDAAPPGEEAVPPGPLDEPPAPPWHFWFESEPLETVTTEGADEMVAGVKEALTAALESDEALLPMLGPDEFVAVAVDFVSDPFFMSGGARERTLVLRASRRDIEARRSGRLSSEQFRERIVYAEY